MLNSCSLTWTQWGGGRGQLQRDQTGQCFEERKIELLPLPGELFASTTPRQQAPEDAVGPEQWVWNNSCWINHRRILEPRLNCGTDSSKEDGLALILSIISFNSYQINFNCVSRLLLMGKIKTVCEHRAFHLLLSCGALSSWILNSLSDRKFPFKEASQFQFTTCNWENTTFQYNSIQNCSQIKILHEFCLEPAHLYLVVDSVVLQVK